MNGSVVISPDVSPQRDKDIKEKINHIKSDRESGFDELSSMMSRSGVDELGTEEGVGTMESSMSAGMEQLSLDQLVLELQSVAVDWRSFRHVHACTCAAPFDCFTKKARFCPIYGVLCNSGQTAPLGNI